MQGRDNGIYLSRRTVYITILVSLSLNAFFLLMGILIGKDDTKWDQEKTPPEEAQVTSPEPQNTDTLSDELALFTPEDDDKPPKPLDLKPLDPGTAPPVTKPAQEKPEPAKKPTAAQPKEAPPKTAANPQQNLGTLTKGYWVQVLASDDYNKANRFKGDLSKLGYPAVVISEKPYYKVLVGPHNAKDDAQRALQQINQRFKTKGWIRQN